MNKQKKNRQGKDKMHGREKKQLEELVMVERGRENIGMLDDKIISEGNDDNV